MSQVDVIERTMPSVFLINVMAKFAASEGRLNDIRNIFHMPEEGSTVDVKMTVNGVEVPFEAAINDLWNQVNDDVDSRALKVAEELIKGAGFEQLFEVIRKAESEVELALNKALKELKAR